MGAALAADCVIASPPDFGEIRRELNRLHLLLLGVKADVADVLSPVRPPSSGRDLERSVGQAFLCLNALRDRMEET